MSTSCGRRILYTVWSILYFRTIQITNWKFCAPKILDVNTLSVPVRIFEFIGQSMNFLECVKLWNEVETEIRSICLYFEVFLEPVYIVLQMIFRQRKFLQVTSVQMKTIKQAQSKRSMKGQKTILLILEHKVAQHSNPVWHQWTAISIRDTIIKVISLFIMDVEEARVSRILGGLRFLRLVYWSDRLVRGFLLGGPLSIFRLSSMDVTVLWALVEIF